MNVNDLAAALKHLPEHAPLVFSTADGPIGAGYHVTELKLADVSSIDCGARTDGWTETTLQLLDGNGKTHMAVGKFTRILEQSARHVEGLGHSPLRVEFAHENAGLQIFAPGVPELVDGSVSISLNPVRAHCKPAMQAIQSSEAASCCGASAGACCTP